MAGTVTRGMPTGEIVKNMLPGRGGGTLTTSTGTFFGGLQVARVPIKATVGAGTVAAAWINPEDGTVIAHAIVVFTTIGNTGTIVVGLKSDGTGTGNDIITSQTMTVGLHYRQTTASALAGTAGETGGFWQLVGPGGTGTNNSITVGHTDAATGTSVGFLIVTYMRVS